MQKRCLFFAKKENWNTIELNLKEIKTEEAFVKLFISPYFVALKATMFADRQGYINTKAVEIRDAALHLIGIFESE